MSITNTSSFFIENQALFGSYPTQQQILQLEEWGIDLIINLTFDNEKKIKPYITICEVIQFSIQDGDVPTDLLKFYSFIIFLITEISNKKRLYIHCKGGHGRACLVVSILLCFIYGISPRTSFYYTTIFHSIRPIHSLKPKKQHYWKNKKFPQSTKQRKFVEQFVLINIT